MKRAVSSTSLLAALAMAALLAGACGGGTDGSPTGGGGSGASASTGGSAQGGGSSTGGGDSGSGGGVTSVQPCSAAMACTIGHCLYPHDSCAPDAEGSCFLGPCDGQPSGPVCRCDATVLESVDGACELWANDEKQAAPSLCIAGTFPCDTLQCQRHAEICVETVGGPAGSGSTFECVAAARANNGCWGDIPDCDCIILEQLGCIQGAACDCTTDPEHNEHVVIAQP